MSAVAARPIRAWAPGSRIGRLTCRGAGAPPGTRTPNPRIKSGLLGRTARSTCTNVSGICPERTQRRRMRSVLVSTTRSTASMSSSAHPVTERSWGLSNPAQRRSRWRRFSASAAWIMGSAHALTCRCEQVVQIADRCLSGEQNAGGAAHGSGRALRSGSVGAPCGVLGLLRVRAG